jgi:hypothetical protein
MRHRRRLSHHTQKNGRCAPLITGCRLTASSASAAAWPARPLVAKPHRVIALLVTGCADPPVDSGEGEGEVNRGCGVRGLAFTLDGGIVGADGGNLQRTSRDGAPSLFAANVTNGEPVEQIETAVERGAPTPRATLFASAATLTAVTASPS